MMGPVLNVSMFIFPFPQLLLTVFESIDFPITRAPQIPFFLFCVAYFQYCVLDLFVVGLLGLSCSFVFSFLFVASIFSLSFPVSRECLCSVYLGYCYLVTMTESLAFN